MALLELSEAPEREGTLRGRREDLVAAGPQVAETGHRSRLKWGGSGPVLVSTSPRMSSAVGKRRNGARDARPPESAVPPRVLRQRLLVIVRKLFDFRWLAVK